MHSDQAAQFGGIVAELDAVVQIGGSALGPDYEGALERGRDIDPTPAALHPGDIQFLLYTSGTTGRPKAVVNEHQGMIAQAFDTAIVTEARHEGVMLAITPFFTAGGMVRTLAWLFLGQTMVIHPRFDPEYAVADIERLRVSMTTFIPTMLLRLLRRLEGDHPATFRACGESATGLPPSRLGSRARRWSGSAATSSSGID